jgi:glycosyltransferase involved in cell wall biosynthesis
MNYPRLTIVTINRNYGRFLPEAIESVLNQHYPNLEYFVLDAGSTDDSPAIIKRYASKLDYWRSAPDGGPAAALNEALDRATGEWFYYLNSDDFLLPGALAAFAAVVRCNPTAGWISGGRHDVDAAGKLIRKVMPWRQQPHLFALSRMHHVAEGTFLNVGYLRHENLRFDERYFNIFDTVLYTQLDRRGPPLYADTFFATMRWHGDNKSGPGNRAAVIREVTMHTAQVPPNSWLHRLYERVNITRFAHANDAVYSFAFRHGFAGPRQKLEAAVPDSRGDFHLMRVRQALRSNPPLNP